MNRSLINSSQDSKQNQSSVYTNNKIDEIQSNLDSIKHTLIDNMDKLTERGEKLDDLKKKTDQMYYDANIFKKSANRLKRKLCMQNIKKNIIIFLFLLVILALIGYAIYSAIEK